MENVINTCRMTLKLTCVYSDLYFWHQWRTRRNISPNYISYGTMMGDYLFSYYVKVQKKNVHLWFMICVIDLYMYSRTCTITATLNTHQHSVLYMFCISSIRKTFIKNSESEILCPKLTLGQWFSESQRSPLVIPGFLSCSSPILIYNLVKKKITIILLQWQLLKQFMKLTYFFNCNQINVFFV